MAFWNPFRREVKNVSIGEFDKFMDLQVLARLGGVSDIGLLRRHVPWLFRGVDLIAQAIHDYPFDIVSDSGDVLDSSTDWQDELGFTHDIFRLLYLVSASLTLRGKSYVYPARNRIAVKELRYWVADTITPIITETNGLEKFVRQVGTIKTEYPVTEAAPYPICYFWLPDPDVELGAPLAYPAQAALNAAGVLFSLDDFFRSHVDDGMKKAILFAVKGLPPTGSEAGKSVKDKLENELSRVLLGKQNTNKIRVVNADTMAPVIYGEGLQEIANTELMKEKREDIATALGIPGTILWSSEGGGLGGAGVTKEDTYRFYKQKVIPDFNFIASVLNHQLLNSLGYRIVGNPETLDAFQEDETQRSVALGSITNAISTDPTIAKFTMELLGYDLSEDQEADLDALIAAKEERAAAMAQAASQQPNPVPPQLQNETPKQTPPVGESMQQKAFRDDLARWQRKVENRLQAGKSAQVEFESEAIDADTHADIYTSLAAAADADAVKAIFKGAQPSESSDRPFAIKAAPTDYESLRAEYRDAIAALLLAYLAGTMNEAAFNQAASVLIQQDLTKAARMGGLSQGAGAIDQGALDSVIKAEIDNLQNAKADIAANGVDNRAELYGRTMDATYSQAAMDAIPNPDTAMLTFVGIDGRESCATCQKLKGQTHPLSWWNERMLVPAIGNTKFDCGGWLCQHYLQDQNGDPVTIGFV